jgi:hypothetical protein
MMSETRETSRRGPEGQRVTHREHRDGRVDAIVQPAPILLRAKAQVLDVGVSETMRARTVRSRADIRRGGQGE